MAVPGQSLAVTAEALFLINLLLAPGLAFVVLVLLYLRHRHRAEPLAANHLSQTVGVSLIGGAALLLVSVSMVALGGFNSAYTWMLVLVYFILVHSSLILLGVVGLVKALAGQHYRYPVLGRPFTP